MMSEVVSITEYDIDGFMKDARAGQAREFVLADMVPARGIAYADFAALCPVDVHTTHLMTSSLVKTPLGIWTIGHMILKAELPQSVIDMSLRDNPRLKHESTRRAVFRNRPVAMFAIGVDLETAAPVTSLIATDGYAPVPLLATFKQYAQDILKTLQ